MLHQLDDVGVGKVHPTQRSLKIIASRANIMPLNIPESESPLSSIADIPEGVAISCGIPTANEIRVTANDVIDDVSNPQQNKNSLGCDMIIDILNNVVLNGLPMTSTNPHDLQNDSEDNVKQLSFKSIIEKYTIDVKQSVAFKIMACSFVLKSLTTQNITENTLQSFFHENESKRNRYTDCLKGFKKRMKDKGGEDNLVMFLSGMGGTGKSEVIKAFIHFAKSISTYFDWNYDTDVIKTIAYTGAAACQIPDGRTIHSQASLMGKIGEAHI